MLSSPRSLFSPSFLVAAAARPSIHGGRSLLVLHASGEFRRVVGGDGDPYGVAGATGTSAAGERIVQHHGDDANAGAQRNERGRQRNVGLSSVPALCRPFKLSVPPCLETPCKYVKIASAAVAAVCVVQTFFPLHFIFISIFFLPPSPQKNAGYLFFVLFFSHVRAHYFSATHRHQHPLVSTLTPTPHLPTHISHCRLASCVRLARRRRFSRCAVEGRLS